MMFDLPRPVQDALRKLNHAGFEAYLVGGGVRDALMGIPPKDYDITTSALPEQTKLVFSGERLIETGIKHGTVTVLLEDMPLEITTFRFDGKYSDFRHPDTVDFSTNLIDDLSRRDFTVNALAYHPSGGVVDCFGGQEDLRNHIIRCVGSPAKRFQEDALRILRAIRFSSVFGFSIEKATAEAILRERNLLRYVSAERLYSEFIQLLCGKNVRAVLEDYIDVIGELIPQALCMVDCPQNCVYHCYDVFRHTTHAVAAIPADPILRLAAFFHDIGKPACRTTDENHHDHFYGHNTKSAQITEQALYSLRADAKTIRTVTKLVQHHDTPIAENERSLKRALNKLSPDGLFQMLELKRADTLAHAPHCHDRLHSLDTLKALAETILNRQDCFSLKQLAVSGTDLIRAGIPEGKQVGATLQLLLDAVLDGAVENDKDALLSYAHTKA